MKFFYFLVKRFKFSYHFGARTFSKDENLTVIIKTVNVLIIVIECDIVSGVGVMNLLSITC